MNGKKSARLVRYLAQSRCSSRRGIWPAVQIGHARGEMRRSISQNRSDRLLGKAWA
jgi:hypothetical protein